MAKILSKEERRLEELNKSFSAIGPEYPEMGATVAKFRRVAAKAGSIAAMSKAERWAYGEAVEKAIRAKHRASLLGSSVALEGPPKDIGAATRARHAAALAACPGLIRRARTPREWETMYAAAMAEKEAAGGRNLSAEGRKVAVKKFRTEREEAASELRELRAEMRTAGIKKTSPFNGGMDRETYRCNARRFELETKISMMAEKEAA